MRLSFSLFLIGCGDLAQKVERYKRRRQHIDEDVIWRYLIQCLKALENLHGKGICHRDIKVANSFLAEDGSIKIGDMNVSKRMHKGHLHTQIGTPYYMSPEIWNNRPYDASSDIWSLGCMMYELCKCESTKNATVHSLGVGFELVQLVIQRLDQRFAAVDIEVVGRLVEDQDVRRMKRRQ